MDYKALKWSPEFEAEYGPQMMQHLGAIKHECINGKAIIWQSENGVFILGPDGTELVVMFMSGLKMDAEIKDILAYAKERFKSIRLCSYRKGMEKFAKSYGLEKREVIMAKEF